jgi:hypothetical protein
MVAATKDFNHYQAPCRVLEITRPNGKGTLTVVMTDEGNIFVQMWGWILDRAKKDRQPIAHVNGVYLVPVEYIIDPDGLGDMELASNFLIMLPGLVKAFSGESSDTFKVKVVDG